MSPPSPFTCMPSAADRLAYLCSLRDYVPETPRHSAFLLDHLRERFWLEKDHDCVVATIQLVAHLIAEHPSPSATAAAAAVAYNIANDFKQWLKRSVSIGLVDDVVGERRNTRSLSADWYPTSVSRKNSEDQGRDSKAAHKTVVSSTVIIRTLLRALYRIGLQTKAGVYHNSHPRPLSTSSSSFPSLSSASLSALSPPPSTSPLPFSQLPWFAQLMQHPSAAIREDCLSLLASTSPLPRLASLQQAHATRKLLHTIAEFVADPHPRVRAGSLLALIRLHMRGARLDVHLYRKALRALKAEETDERVRILGMHLLWVLACIHPNHAVGFYQGEPICMVDDVFTKICIKVNDVSTKVRVAACTLLGRFQGVERNRVLQTFSKKPLDELSRDRALAVDKGKQKARVGARTSLFWLPEGDVSLEQASLDHGWAGAFIHAWEDEFLEVRIAAISSLCEIGIRSPSLYAAKALQMMVEMFNDDSKEVRLEAINSVARLGELVHLSDEHVSIVLLAFEDTASSIRRAVMRLFSRMHLSEPVRFSLIVSALTAGMQRYPCDVQPIYRTLQSFGAHQPHMTEFTLPSLLASPLPPPSVSTPNARVEKPVAYDRRYIGRLIVVYNAAIKHNAIFAHLAPHYKEQFLYLARQYPGFFPPSVYLTPSLAADADRRAMAGRDVRAQLQRFVSTIRSLLAQSFALSPRTAAASKVSSTPRALCLSSSYMRQLSRSLQHIHRQLYSVLLTTAPSSLPPSPSSSLSSQASMDNHALAFFLVDYTAALLLILDLLPVLVRFYTHALHVSSPSSSSPTADTTDPGEVAPAVRQKITRAKYCLMHILARYQGLSVGWRHHSTRWVLVLSLYSCKLDLDRQLQQQRQQPHFARASVSLNQDFLQSLHVLLSLSDGTESTSAFPFYLQRNVLLWARHRHNLGPSSNGITGDSNGHGCGEYNKNDIDAEERVSKKRKIDSVPNVPGTFSVSSSAAAAMPSPPPSVSKVLASLLASALLPDRVHDLELNRTRAVLSEPQCDPTRVLWLSTSAVCPVCIPVRFSMQHVYDTSRIRIVISFCPPASCSSSSPYRAGDLIFTPAAADCSALSAPDSVLSDWSVHSIIELTLPHIRQLKATNESRTASSESVCKAKDSVISGRHDEHKNSNNSNNNINNNNYNYNNNNNNNNNDDGSFVVYVSIASLFHCSDDCSSSPASMQAYDIPHGIVASSTASSSLFASVNSVLAGLNDGHNVLVPVSRALALRVRVT